MVDNEFNNYQRSYNNQEWNPAGSLSRQKGHSREMGAIVNTYLQVNRLKSLPYVHNSELMPTSVARMDSHPNSISTLWNNLH